MIAVSATVPAVEQMQERAREKEQVGEGAQGMGGVLGQDEKGRDGGERQQHEARA
jgi:hypothetical protein